MDEQRVQRIGGRIVFAGCVRDCAEHLPAVLNNLAAIAALFDEAAFVFAENDSKDNTVAILHDWATRHLGVTVIQLHGLTDEPTRGLRLEMARNAYVAFIRQDAALSQYDWLVVVDMDEPNKPPVDIDTVRRAFAFLAAEPNRVAGFANQTGIYYDVWTLRHPKLMPGDAWEAVFDHKFRHRCTAEEAFDAAFRPHIYRIAPSRSPVEVNSAFGGLGIYKLPAVLRNPHPYRGSKAKILRNSKETRAYRWQVCEHVHFNEGLRLEGGRLYILPFLINCDTSGYVIPPTGYRGMLF